MNEKDPWTFNRGEWSEAYTFTKLLGEGKVYAADEKLDKIEDEFYPILKIIKKELEKQFIRDSNLNIVQVTDLEGNTQISMSVEKFLEISEKLLIIIKESKGSSFSIPTLESFFNDLGIIKFKSSSNDKSDLTMEIKDLGTLLSKEYNFSIKSELGSKPTLLNASKSTNFIYKIEGIEDYEINELMKITKKTDNKWLKIRIYNILEKINRKGYNLSFHEIENPHFSSNLKLIDSNLPFIVSQILLHFYSTEKISDIKSLTEFLINKNPLNLPNKDSELFYKTNIIELIKAAAFGMMPSKKWNKEYDVNGGILTVKKDGNVLCHHIFYNKKQLDEYLYRNTKLDTPSTKRYKQGDLYKLDSDNNYYFKLNCLCQNFTSCHFIFQCFSIHVNKYYLHV
ncbi:HpaII family restriction endonuclease [Methanobrevibacter filiformis]|uniref:HpaII restriction endonuclease n=1 Tax=Methanobrevibacter filiformis TaxID=55758 RepID=A0A166CCM7_9EURY|nr:HpaII family restriction endonuclease [Methanobrevibacter filiformis]KZX14370.1 HpaII restriction endonuclease [Methanobrevibacter filiformis]